MTDKTPSFVVGKEYNRRADIHKHFKGQQYGGISTPADYPAIFIFTSNNGEQYGYEDTFVDGVFWYTGEGQTGDMEMKAGNLAIRDHVKNKKTIHVFEQTKKAHVRYKGSAECLGYHVQLRPDGDHKQRKAFIFHLDLNSIDSYNRTFEPTPYYSSNDLKTLPKKNLKELREAALTPSPKAASPEEKVQKAYYRSEALKFYVIARSKGFCEGCNAEAPFLTKDGPYLECHHVNRLADGGPDHPMNVIALCPNCHRRAHYSKDASKYNDELKAKAIEIENSVL